MQSNDSVTARDESPDLRPGIRLTVTLAADTSLPRVLELIHKIMAEPDVRDVTWPFDDPQAEVERWEKGFSADPQKHADPPSATDLRVETSDLRPVILTVRLAHGTSLHRILELIIKFRKEPDVKDVTWAFVDQLTPSTDHERVLVDQIMWLIGQYAPV
jgi:hypothetical protein